MRPYRNSAWVERKRRVKEAPQMLGRMQYAPTGWRGAIPPYASNLLTGAHIGLQSKAPALVRTSYERKSLLRKNTGTGTNCGKDQPARGG